MPRYKFLITLLSSHFFLKSYPNIGTLGFYEFYRNTNLSLFSRVRLLKIISKFLHLGKNMLFYTYTTVTHRNLLFV